MQASVQAQVRASPAHPPHAHARPDADTRTCARILRADSYREAARQLDVMQTQRNAADADLEFSRQQLQHQEQTTRQRTRTQTLTLAHAHTSPLTGANRRAATAA